MIEVVIQLCQQGDLLSKAGLAEYNARQQASVTDMNTIQRDDPVLVAMMKEDAGKRIWGGECSRVRISQLPDGFKWKIMQKKNREWIASETGS